MRKNPKNSLKVVAAAAVGVVAFNLAAYSIVDAVERTCTNRTCIEFVQWRFLSGGTYNYREAIGGERWSYLDACCHPSVNQEWCTSKPNLADLGESTRKIMDYGTLQCTSASCPGAKTQVAVSNMFIENVNATRYVCFDFGGE